MIVLGEHLRLVREGIRRLLEHEKDMEVIGELANGLKIVPAIGRLKRGVLVVALGLPGLNGTDFRSAPGRRRRIGPAPCESWDSPGSSSSSDTPQAAAYRPAGRSVLTPPLGPAL